MGISAAWDVSSVDSSFVMTPTHRLPHSSVIVIFVYYMLKLSVACSINAMPEYKNPHVKSVLHHLLFKEMDLKLARHFIQIISSQAISFYTRSELVILLRANSSFNVT